MIDARTLTLGHGKVHTPAFLPDGTVGVVKAVDSADVAATGIQMVQMNAFHLMQQPGTSTVKALGGLHALSGWQGPISTDSGGYQIYSMIRQNPKLGSITAGGATFRVRDRKFKLTPEKAIRQQIDLGSDLIFALDDCTHVDAPRADQERSVARTTAWARACKATFDRVVAERELAPAQRPKLFGIVQGGGFRDLRERAAEALLGLGFDGFGYGGWPLDAGGGLLTEMLGYVRELIPPELPLHALGVGHPANIVETARLGYALFDSTMPTRDARHGRLWVFDGPPEESALAGDFFGYLRMTDGQLVRDNRPVSEHCDCHTCRHYSRGYLHHLHAIGDPLYARLATIHNLRFVAQLMARLRALAGAE